MQEMPEIPSFAVAFCAVFANFRRVYTSAKDVEVYKALVDGTGYHRDTVKQWKKGHTPRESGYKIIRARLAAAPGNRPALLWQMDAAWCRRNNQPDPPWPPIDTEARPASPGDARPVGDHIAHGPRQGEQPTLARPAAVGPDDPRGTAEPSAPAAQATGYAFRADLSLVPAITPDHWFRFIVQDAPPDARDQLVFSIDYRPYSVSLVGGSGARRMQFQLRLPAVRVLADWGEVAQVEGSIRSTEQARYRLGWTVILPQDANLMALDAFAAARLRARSPGSRLPLSVHARREDLDVRRLDNNASANGNREKVIAQALRVLGIEDGDAEWVRLAVGAAVAVEDPDA